MSKYSGRDAEVEIGFERVKEKYGIDLKESHRGFVPVPFEVWKELGYTDEEANILAWASIVCA